MPGKYSKATWITFPSKEYTFFDASCIIFPLTSKIHTIRSFSFNIYSDKNMSLDIEYAMNVSSSIIFVISLSFIEPTRSTTTSYPRPVRPDIPCKYTDFSEEISS